jgi:hypothetical protein
MPFARNIPVIAPTGTAGARPQRARSAKRIVKRLQKLRALRTRCGRNARGPSNKLSLIIKTAISAGQGRGRRTLIVKL